MRCARQVAIAMTVVLCLLHWTSCIAQARQPPVVQQSAGPRSAIPEELQLRIEAAIPAKSLVRPAQPRKLLVFTRNVGYGGHPSMYYANYAVAQMGKKTGAFETVITDDPAVFAPESLSQFDAVFFNNNVGNLFDDVTLRNSLVDFVYSGGGMLGVHGTTVAFTVWPGAHEDWPEFGRMIGARGANHRDSDEHVFVKLDDPSHPLNFCFPREGFEYRDEFFRVHEPYSRDRLRVLLSIDTEKTDLKQGAPRGVCERADNDYALAWVRNYGRGRVFYCTIAHNPYVFWDPQMLQFYLGAIQFALGDLEAPTTPSGFLTPAVRGQESLGWRLALMSSGQGPTTLFETVDLAAGSNVQFVTASLGQTVSNEIESPFDDRLTADQRRQIRRKLDDAGVRLLSYRLDTLPGDEAGLRKLLTFARNMGMETLVVDKLPETADRILRLSREYRVRVSVRAGRGFPQNAAVGDPRIQAIAGAKLGTQIDLAGWIDSGTDSQGALPMIADSLTTVRIPGTCSVAGLSDEVFVERFDQFLKHARTTGIRPIVFDIEPVGDTSGWRAEVARCAEQFQQLCLKNDPNADVK